MNHLNFKFLVVPCSCAVPARYDFDPRALDEQSSELETSDEDTLGRVTCQCAAAASLLDRIIGPNGISKQKITKSRKVDPARWGLQ